eukprot:CAMPEP_0168422312 /NCGR_PEP_ID=MMETSP0228-20121227/33730_1 /TAXON_ID=133427 /ORGANISM="Protoceratium reticulatum, Strain CCCM 535 (=CCMP 1889)" /LENGTH=213 /DNA_ID=CAMNT_0008436243 /DNA_START=1 /DNA_END=642 /DNA_ORIENTATION=+
METIRRQLQVQLRLELSGTVGGARKEWDQKLQEWSREVATMRAQLEELREARGREALQLGGGGGGGLTRLGPEHQGAMRSTELLESSSRKLEEARRLALESEHIGQGVLSDLAAQRETMIHARDNMRTIDSELSAARQSIGRMLATAQRNRLLTLVIAAVLGTGLAVWALCILRLPMKQNVALAAGLVALTFACCIVRRRLAARAALRAGGGS